MICIAVSYLIWGIFPPGVGQGGSFIPKPLLSKVWTFVQKVATDYKQQQTYEVQLILNQQYLTQSNK